MNIKLLTLATAVAVSAAVAQDYDDEYEESTSTEASTEATQEESEPEPAPVAAAPQVAPQPMPVYQEPAPAEQPAAAPAQGGLNVLHGNAYNMVGNEAAASTIGGDMNAVYKMNGRKLIYVEPSDKYGALALGSGSMTYLLAFDNSEDLGMLTAGIAMKSFGIALDVALNKEWRSHEVNTANNKNTNDRSTTGQGDIIQLRLGALLGGVDLTAQLYWLTYQDETDTETDNGVKVEHDEDYWTLGGNLAISNGPSAKNLAWSFGAQFYRHTDWQKDSQGNQSREVTGENAYIHIQPFFNLGTPVFQSENANVFLGLNTFVPVRIYDEIEEGEGNATTTNNRMSFGLYTSPNILGEMAVNENWIVFAGATYLWNVFSRSSTEKETSLTKTTDDTSIITMHTYATQANAGVRFQYSHLIVEASIANDLGSDAWAGLVGNLGVFFTF